MPYATSPSAGFSGGCCPRNTPNGKVSTVTSAPGARKASGDAFTIRCEPRCGEKQGGISTPRQAVRIARVSKPRPLQGFVAMTVASRSRAANGTFWSIRSAYSWPWSSRRPPSKTGMAQNYSFNDLAVPAKSCGWFGWMVAIAANSLTGWWSIATSACSLSCVPIVKRVSLSCRGVGWWK